MLVISAILSVVTSSEENVLLALLSVREVDEVNGEEEAFVKI